MTTTETNPIGTMERLRRCEEALLSALPLIGKIAPDIGVAEQIRRQVRAAIIQAQYAALTSMTKPEQEGV